MRLYFEITRCMSDQTRISLKAPMTPPSTNSANAKDSAEYLNDSKASCRQALRR